MAAHHDPNQTADSPAAADSLDAALEAGFGPASALPPSASESRLARLRAGVGATADVLLRHPDQEAVTLLRQAQFLHPDDVRINCDLGFILITMQPRRTDEPLGYYRAALARRRARRCRTRCGAGSRTPTSPARGAEVLAKL